MSMTRIKYVDFLQQVTRLTDTYGDKHYPQERIKAIWDELKELPAQSVEKIITDLIADKQYPPMRDAFRAAAAGLKGWVRDPEIVELYLNSSCRWCNLTGAMIARLTDPDTSGGRFAFRCPYCRAAVVKNLSIKIPAWSKKFVGRFWPEYGDGKPAGEEDVWDTPNEIAYENLEAIPEPVQPEVNPESSPDNMRQLVKQITRQMPTVNGTSAEEIQPEFDL